MGRGDPISAQQTAYSRHHTHRAGKSLIYQFAALQFEGLTLVISPLIALMQDQVDALNRKGIPATFINSAISSAE
jgi:ATP-dependent DNA helicase RecQ